ncbi:zinc finger protein 394-like [Cyprinus carpio]|uniref:Zinc finger protein 394-like n=1 Tax=Cyprinus carpio TaxID=7962 RepID=A0A9Q9WG72_CYPCA|nr:zinc finger protein 394-like [Cyprinus carpio]
MDSDDAINYDDVKQAILDQFEINNEMYRQRFRSYSAQEDETPRELQVRLKDLYEKWMTPKHRTKEEIGDQIVLEQFLKLLSLDTRTWVKQNNPTSSKQVAEMAEAFMAARRSLNQPRRWRNYSISPTGADWDHWLPYLMFAYREVPQVSTGYSPFELLYGRQVRGLLDVLKEAWEADNGSEHILSYVIKMREKMDSMVEMVRSNMTNAQQQQKQ